MDVSLGHGRLRVPRTRLHVHGGLPPRRRASPDEQLAILGVLEEAETTPLSELRGLADNAGRRAGF